MRTKLLFIGLMLISLIGSQSNMFAQTIYVNSSTGNDGTGTGTSSSPYKTFTKGYAMTSAGGTIDLTGTFTLTDADETGDATTTGFTIAKNITIQGQGADKTMIQAATSAGGNTSRIFTIDNGTNAASGFNVTIKNLEIRYGYLIAANDGGAILASWATISISNCYIHNNQARQGMAIQLQYTTMTLVNSTVSNNSSTTTPASAASGGAINFSTASNTSDAMTITNTTIYNNTGAQYGGGISTAYGTYYITNCTIVNNSCYLEGGGISIGGYSTSPGKLYIKNTIVANNTSTSTTYHDYDDAFGGYTYDNGYNIIEYHDSPTLAGTGTITGNQANLFGTGIASTPSLGANNTLNGTLTLALSAGSVAINAGSTVANSSVAIPTTDQRGLNRVGATDIGAFEFGAAAPSPTITGISPTNGGTAGGTSVIITGINLTAASGVKFGSTNASSYTVNSATQITAISPVGSLGTVDVTVTTPGGTSATGSSDQFTYIAAPIATSNAASSITTTGATLNGSINANNATTVVTFEYGLTTSYGTSVTATQSPVTGTTGTAVSYALTSLVPNTTYHFRVKGVSTSGTTNGTDLTFTTTAAVPTATTSAATSITTTGATLNGSINANNASTTVSFDYGTTTSYGTNVTATQSPVTGTTGTAVSYALTGLIPNTTYHFRVKGVNTAGTTNGTDLTFTTTAAVPTATTSAASSITTTGATLNGSINANNASTAVSFEYGLTTSYGINVTAIQSPVTGTTGTAVSYALTGLAPNTTYHFRVNGVNTAGTTNGADLTFSTEYETGLNNIGENSLSIYPNPANDYITIYTSESNYRVLIYNTDGIPVLNQKVEGDKLINISSLQKGVYVVKLNGVSGKLVKK